MTDEQAECGARRLDAIALPERLVMDFGAIFAPSKTGSVRALEVAPTYGNAEQREALRAEVCRRWNQAPPIAVNGPNRAWGTHHVEVVLQLWDYRTTVVLDVGGNTLGYSVIEHAIGQVVDRIAEAGRVELVNDDGDTLITDSDQEPWTDRRVHAMVVSARITGYTPPTLNTVRARNGAEPLPDGGGPCDRDAEDVARRRAARST